MCGHMWEGSVYNVRFKICTLNFPRFRAAEGLARRPDNLVVCGIIQDPSGSMTSTYSWIICGPTPNIAGIRRGTLRRLGGMIGILRHLPGTASIAVNRNVSNRVRSGAVRGHSGAQALA